MSILPPKKNPTHFKLHRLVAMEMRGRTEGVCIIEFS
jgi:hypothetical protein